MLYCCYLYYIWYMSTTNTNQLIWQAIAGKRLDEAKVLLMKILPVQKAKWFTFQKKGPDDDVNFILQLALKIISAQPIDKFTQYKLSLNNKGTEAFAELVSLLNALHNTRLFEQQVLMIEEFTIRTLITLADDVREASNGYPENSISALVWMGGFSIRQWCNALANYFNKKEDNANFANAVIQKAKITCSIMNHYPYEVGPDMLAAVSASENIGEAGLAKSFNNAVINDFKNIVTNIRSYPEEVTAEDIICIESLKTAYENDDRFSNINTHAREIEELNDMIKTGITAVPEEADDGDE